jgi:hypothetical protein
MKNQFYKIKMFFTGFNCSSIFSDKLKSNNTNLTTKHSKLKTHRGATIIELLLYMAILAFFLLALVTFAINIIQGGSKNSNESRTYADARYLSERIKYEVRNASDIQIANSNFGVNLATTPGSKLTLTAAIPNNPTVFDVSTGRARITLGAASAVELNSNKVNVTDLTFTNYSGTNTKNINFTLTVQSTVPSMGNIKETTTLRSSVELRSN